MGGKNRAVKKGPGKAKKISTSAKVSNKKANKTKRQINVTESDAKALRKEKRGKKQAQARVEGSQKGGGQKPKLGANKKRSQGGKDTRKGAKLSTHEQGEQGEEEDEEAFVPSGDEEDLEYLSRASNRSALLSGDLAAATAGGRHEKKSKQIQHNLRGEKRKQKQSKSGSGEDADSDDAAAGVSSDDEELPFEQRQRDNRHWQEPKATRLPTRDAEGKWVAAKEATRPAPPAPASQTAAASAGASEEAGGDEEAAEDEGEGEEQARDDDGQTAREADGAEEEEVSEEAEEEEVSEEELARRQERRRQRQKLVIAGMCDALLTSPDKHVGKLDSLLAIAQDDPDASVRELSVLSVVEVFKDLMPDYRIRLPTEKELQNRVTKEVKSLREYEKTFLSAYSRLVTLLCDQCRALGFQKGGAVVPRPLQVVCKGLTVLLQAGYQFNFRKELLRAVVPLLQSGYAPLRTLALEAIRAVFADDKAGDAALEAVTMLGGIVKKKLARTHTEVIAAFSFLPLSKAAMEAANKETKEEKRKRLNKLSKKEKKELDIHLEEANAQVEARHRSRTQTAMLTQIFVAYFRLLRLRTNSAALAEVLRGLSQFADLINLELVLDLLQSLKRLTSPDNPSRLSLEASLHCVATAFTVLHRQGDIAELDLKEFYTHLYELVWEMAPTHNHRHLPLLLKCLRLMFQFRKQLSTERVAAFVRRLAIVALHLPPAHAIATAHCIRGFFQTCPRATQLLDRECTISGVFSPLTPNPDLANAFASTCWELALLAASSHPYQRKYSAQLLCGEELGASEHMLLPIDMLRRFDAREGAFNPPIQPPRSKLSKAEVLRRKQLATTANVPGLRSPFLAGLLRNASLAPGADQPGQGSDAEADELCASFRALRCRSRLSRLAAYRQLTAQLATRKGSAKTHTGKRAVGSVKKAKKQKIVI